MSCAHDACWLCAITEVQRLRALLSQEQSRAMMLERALKEAEKKKP